MDSAASQEDVDWFSEAPTFLLRDRITVGRALSPTGRHDVVIALEVHNEPVVYAIDPDRADALAALLRQWAGVVRSLREGEETE